MYPRSKLLWFAVASFCLVTGCSQQKIEDSPQYQAACHGPPLRTIERRNQAAEDGFTISREYDCIDKASYAAFIERRAAWEAANTPNAIAERKADHERLVAEEEQARRSAAAIEAQSPSPPASIPTLHLVEVNTATESELQNVASISHEVAAQIVAERNKRQFKDWADVINRVIGLSSAQTAVFASVSGLVVDGKSLPGAPPDAALAAALADRKLQRSRIDP
jgi:DNA uptake protein ComE-like DNA-binding protein